MQQLKLFDFQVGLEVVQDRGLDLLLEGQDLARLVVGQVIDVAVKVVDGVID